MQLASLCAATLRRRTCRWCAAPSAACAGWHARALVVACLQQLHDCTLEAVHLVFAAILAKPIEADLE